MSSRVTTFDASTSGWSKGLIPITRSRDRRRELPPEELAAEVVEVVDPDPDDRLPGALDRLDRRVLLRVGVGAKPHVDEQAIVAVRVRRAERLAVDGDHALPLLAGRLRQQLLEPGAEVADRGRRHERELVAPALRADADRRPEHEPGVVGGRHAGGAAVRHPLGPIEQLVHVDSHHRARHHAEVGQRRVAAADRLDAVGDVRESPSPRPAARASSPGR